MERSPRVAVVQMKSSENKAENLKVSIDLIKEAARHKARLVCFPEFQMAFSPTSEPPKQLVDIAESAETGRFISMLCNACRTCRIGVVSTVYEKSSKPNEGRVYDTAVLINDKGNILSTYRKLHLYDALGFRESHKLLAGNAIEDPSQTTIGKLGLMICYDLRFPEMSRILAVQGAEILVAPSAWVHGVMKEEHWETMLKARAIENGLYIIAPNQLGNIFSGRSMVIDPFGVVELDIGSREGMEIVEIDRSRVRDVRKSLPLLKNRRTDVYRNYARAFS